MIAIDFDGTLVRHKYPAIGTPIPGAFEYCRMFQEKNVLLILWTMRSGKSLEEAVEFCAENSLVFWGVNVNPDQHTWTTSRKAYANLYIDDAAFGCPLIHPSLGDKPFVDWSVVGPAVLDMIEKGTL